MAHISVSRAASVRSFFTASASLAKSGRWNQNRKAKKPKKVKELTLAKIRYGSRYKLPPSVVQAPLSLTQHPTDRFAEEEAALVAHTAAASAKDAPVVMCERDPYDREPAMCALCPRKFDVPIRPHFKVRRMLLIPDIPSTRLFFCAESQTTLAIRLSPYWSHVQVAHHRTLRGHAGGGRERSFARPGPR